MKGRNEGRYIPLAKHLNSYGLGFKYIKALHCHSLCKQLQVLIKFEEVVPDLIQGTYKQ